MSENRPSKIEDRLSEAPPLLLDGGLATELERRGHDLNHPLWSARLLLENPEAVRAVHEDFLDAGADIIVTASYQASLPGLKKQGLTPSRAEGVLLDAVDLAINARDRFIAKRGGGEAGPPGDPTSPTSPLVAASLGPYGAFLANGSEYTGNYENSKSSLFQFHRERLEILTNSPIDLLAFETIPSLTEAEVLTELLISMPRWRAWISFQCRDDAHLADGTPLIEAVRVVDSAPNVFAIGVNCVPPRNVPALIARIRSGSTKAIAVYPNSGEAFDTATKTWSGTADPLSFASAAREWREAGAALIGGCCRTTPEHIRALREAFPAAGRANSRR